jgi:translocation and assembly module TamB
LRRLVAILLIPLALLIAVPLIAQDQMTPEEQKDWFVQFVEGQLSTPERQIRISNIDGVLSETASIREVTISDQQGVWLRINNAAINWDQGALFTGTLFVRSLTADSIDFVRNPIPSGDPNLPAPEAGPLQVPEFPVTIILEKLAVPSVKFGESVFGLGSEISVEGGLRLDGGSLTANLDIARLDGPGGTLSADVAYRKAENAVDVGVTLTEPPNGIIANLLNIEGRPEIALSVTGSGPVNDLVADMALDAGGQRALSGRATIAQQAEGLVIGADLRGPIGDLVAPAYRPFFGAETSLTANALVRSAGGVSITGLRISGGQLSLEGSAETTADNFLRVLQLQAVVSDPAGGEVLLPIPGPPTTIDTAQLTIGYGATGDDDWSANLNVGGFDNGQLTAQSLTMQASGVAAGLDDPATRRVTFNGDGMLSGIVSEDEATQAALGDAIGFGVAALWSAGQPIQLAEFRLEGDALELALAGTIADLVFDGGVSIVTSSIQPFSGLANRDLAGAVALTANGTISPLTGGFNLTLDGNARDLAVDEPALDGVLKGEVALSGRVSRDETGLAAESFRITNPQVTIVADGTFATGAADFTFNLDLADLALVSESASGRLSVVGTAKGKGAIALDFNATVPEGTLVGRRLTQAALGFTGTLLEDNTLSGSIDGDAFLDGFRVALGGDVVTTADTRRISALRFEAGPTVLLGDVTQDAAGLLTGRVQLSSPNVETAAALLLMEATGAAEADIQLSAAEGVQNAEVTASIDDFRSAGVVVGNADVRATIADLFGVPRIDGTINGSSIAAAGVSVASLSARAALQEQTTNFAADAKLDNGTALAVAGSLAPLEGGYRLALNNATLTQGELSARLAQPTALAINGDTVSLDAVQFDVGGGRITATGTAGQTLDVALAIEALPLSIANAVQPNLRLAGTINGTATISGSASAPQAVFDVRGSGINAAAIRDFGIAPLGFAASGSFAENTVRLDRLTAEGAGGLQLSGSGVAPLEGRGLDVQVNGSAPLALGNRFVAERGGQLSGTATFNVAVTGSASDPKVAGRLSLSGGGYVDPELNIRLVGIEGNASVSADRISVESLTANLSTGGSVAISGSVGLGAGTPADLAIRLNSARYADGTLFVATASGDLALSGPLAASPLLSGRVLVEKADITVPEQIGGGAALIEVKHVGTPGDVAATLKRATVDAGGAPIPQSRPSVLQLDVTVAAPNQVFIRGRGLDVEVGGSVRLTGPVNDIRPVGGFQLNRGRLTILGQRVTFTQGEVTLVGDLDPYLNLVAQTQGEGLTVYVTVSGRASEIRVDFTSSPALPQDEVLARLLFNRSMGELSPMQIARLAGAAAELAGGGGNSLVDSLRDKIGLDDLDVVTDEQGNVALQAGRYIQDNIYLGVQAGADGTSRVTVDLDITSDIKARAATGMDGNSSVGVFYEADY